MSIPSLRRAITDTDMALLGHGFDRGSVQRGLGLLRDRAVLDVSHDPEEGILHAWVQGTRPRPYATTVFLGYDGEVDECECSCPVGVHCKHGVAAFLAHRASLPGGTRGLPEPGGRPNRATPSDPVPPSPQTAVRHHLDAWLRRFDDAGRHGASTPDPDTHGTSGGNRRQRLYVLEPVPHRAGPGGSDRPGGPGGNVVTGAHLSIREATHTRTGRLSQGRRFTPRGRYTAQDTVADPIDIDIAGCGAALVAQANRGWYDDDGRYELRGRLGATMLELAIETARTFIGGDRRHPIAPGPSLELRLEWRENEDGVHTLHPAVDGLERWWALATDPPLYIDPDTHRAGRLLTELSGAQLLVALDAPAVPDDELQRFGEALDEMETGRTASPAPARLPVPGQEPARLIPLPAELGQQRIGGTPVPMLCLFSLDDDPHVDSWAVTIVVRYEDVLFACDPLLERTTTRAERPDGSSVRVQRDAHAEYTRYIEFLNRFPDLSSRQIDVEGADTGPPAVSARFGADGGTPAARFRVYRHLVASREALEADGWELVVSPPVHTDVIRPSSFQGLIERDEREPGWFDVSLGFEHAGVRHELMPIVIAWLERGRGDEPVLVEQADGRFLEIPVAALKPVADVFDELGERIDGQDTIRLSRARALALERLEHALDEAGIDTDWHGDREPIDFAKRLRSLADIDTTDFATTPVPRALRATLRPYQRAGLGWLNALAKHELCGILADDMGLGKTVQALAHLLWLRQARRLDGPALVVAPTSLLGNWAREAAQFAPRLRVRVWHGGERHDHPLSNGKPDADLVITSYGLALRDRDLLAGHGFALLVLDEAQQIRNPAAKITRALKSLPIARRLCLSGTPLENHLGELWSQFDFLMPGLLGDAQRFTRHFRTPIERHGDDERRQRLAEAVRPFLLRRRKEAVATELPAKTEMVREVLLDGEQAKLYESIRVAMQERVREALARRGVAQSKITVLDSLLKLRQLCCHPDIVKLPSARRVKESAKTATLLDMLEEMLPEGRRVLVFSQFTSMLSIIERELTARDIAWVKLTGQTRRRDEAIDRFQRGEVPVFLISLKAGGTGLNLTAADTVIHYDPWWNPAAEDQASARAHRIGQDKPVFVYRLVTTGTVEERIVALQARKRQLADGVLERGDAGALASMSAEETLSLFDAV